MVNYLTFASVSYAENVVKSDLDSMSLAGFKIHTTVIRPDKQNLEPNNAGSSISTNNGIVKKTIISDSKVETKSGNIVTTKKADQVVATQNRLNTITLKPKQENITKNNPPQKIAQINPTVKKTTSQPVQNITQPVKTLAKTNKNETSQSSKEFLQENKNTILSENNTKQDKPALNYEDEKINIPEYDEPLSDNVKNAEAVKEPNAITLLSSLSIVIILVLIASWLYNKLRGVDPVALLSGKLASSIGNNFNLLSTTTLGQGKSIHLVEIKGKQLVIGSTNNNINLLTELNEKTKIQEDLEPEENDLTVDHSENIDLSGFPDIYKDYLNDNENKEK
ncbi:MAG: hypothetical protein ACD_20C00259G0007 [uncultured bacterium]|nr:MAG: hypothetical protein ACD_20C00259G0007 [uncultured bacterium]